MKTAGKKKAGRGSEYDLWGDELSDRLYRLQYLSRGGARPGSVQPDRVCAAAFRGGDSGGRNFDRHRAAGCGEPGADGGVVVRSGDRHLHRDWPGFERERHTYAVHGAIATGSLMGVRGGQVLWAYRNAGGEHVPDGDRRVSGAALRRTPIRDDGRLGAGRAVLHRVAVSDRVRAGSVFLVLFDTTYVGGLHLRTVRNRKSGGGSAWFCQNHTGGRGLDRDRHRLSGAEFFRSERDQPGRARRRRARAPDSVQQRVHAALFGDGHLGSGVDLSAPESEMRMSTTRRVNLVALAVLLCSMAGGMATLHAIDHMRRGAVAQQALYLRSSKVLRRLSLGYTGLLADIYWTRAVQYFGEQHHNGSGDFRLLAPLLEVTTELDPRLFPAYQFGAHFLAPKPPSGAGLPGAALSFMKYGVEHNPNEWRVVSTPACLYYTEFK